MVTINLLPWRQAARIRARRNYILTCTFTVVTMLLGSVIGRIMLLHEQQQLVHRQHVLSRQAASLGKRQNEVNILSNKQAHSIKAIAVNMQNKQRLHMSARLLRQLGETMPKGAVMRLLEINDQSINMKMIINGDYLTSQLLEILLKIPELKALQIHQMQRVQNTSDYELLLVGKLSNEE